ncbi:MAG: hypothetical protein A4E57_03645 [Syntrophorhabdaceae bacterium PtaU1.Bin034]|nr:MAG: hypothetical protein A4E57_03645 [Syntrophorhabdaceae bacterium PtaU1.Bin034]
MEPAVDNRFCRHLRVKRILLHKAGALDHQLSDGLCRQLVALVIDHPGLHEGSSLADGPRLSHDIFVVTIGKTAAPAFRDPINICNRQSGKYAFRIFEQRVGHRLRADLDMLESGKIVILQVDLARFDGG